MSVLDTFFILFESDAKDAKRDTEGLSDTLDDVELSADGATVASGDAGAAFLEMGKSAAGAIGGIFALGGIIAGTLAKAEDLDALGKFSQLIGENIEDVGAWEEAIIRSGGSADAFRGTVESLTEKVTDAAIRGENEITPFFNELGISIVDVNGKAKSTLELLPELADAFQGLDNQQAVGIGKKLGLDQATILLLQQGRGEVEKLVEQQRELGVANQEAFEASAEFNDKMADFRQVLGFAGSSLIATFLPAITNMIGVFTDVADWVGENETLVQGFFIGLGAAVLKFAIPPMISLATTVFAAVAPFVAIGVAVTAVATAFALLYEDVVAFLNGQDSAIGEISKKWPIVGEVVKGVVNMIKQAFEALKSLAEFIGDVFTNPTKALEKIKSLAGGLLDFIGLGDDEEKEINIKTTEEVEEKPTPNQVRNRRGRDRSDTQSVEKTKEAKQPILDVEKIKEIQQPTQDVKIANEFITSAQATPVNAITSNAISNMNENKTSNRTVNVQLGNIEVNSESSDPVKVAESVNKSISREIQTAIANYDDGVVI